MTTRIYCDSCGKGLTDRLSRSTLKIVGSPETILSKIHVEKDFCAECYDETMKDLQETWSIKDD